MLVMLTINYLHASIASSTSLLCQRRWLFNCSLFSQAGNQLELLDGALKCHSTEATWRQRQDEPDGGHRTGSLRSGQPTAAASVPIPSLSGLSGQSTVSAGLPRALYDGSGAGHMLAKWLSSRHGMHSLPLIKCVFYCL